MSSGTEPSPAVPVVGGVPGWEVPVPAPLFVGRKALLARLDGLVGRAITFVSGWAGTGKTALVAAWCRTRSPHRVAWLAVRPDDSTESVYGQVISAIAVLTQRDPRRGATALDVDGGRLTAAAIDRLARDLEAAIDCVIVIDGAGPSHLELALDLAAVIEASPGCGLHVVVLSRCVPPPEVIALRLRGTADHLTAHDLAADATDLADVVTAHAPTPLDDITAAALAARLDGWMVGGAIVGLAHPGTRDATLDQLLDVAIEHLDAYVTSEILGGLAEDQRRVLHLTASAGVLDPDLVVAMTGRQEAVTVLDELRRAGLPITRRGMRSGEFEYVRPFREVLELQSQRRDPRAHIEAMRSAARWFGRHRLPVEAADTWARLGQWDAAIEVIAMHVHLIGADDASRLADVVARLPPVVMREHLDMALQAAWMLCAAGRISAAFEMLAIHEPVMAPAARVVSDVIRSSVASWVDDAPGVLGFAESALERADRLEDGAYDDIDVGLAPAVSSSADVNRTIAHGNALTASAFGGLWHRGEPHLEALRVDVTAMLLQTQLVQLHGNRAVYLALSGRPNTALFEAHQSLAVASEVGVSAHHAAEARFALGESQRLMSHPAEALDTLTEALRLASAGNRRTLAAAITGSRALALVDAGQHQEAIELVQRHRSTRQVVGSTMIAAMLAVAEARALAAGGAYRSAVRVLDRAAPTAKVASARVAIAVASGELARARAVVDAWPTEPTVDARVRQAIAAAVVSASGRAGGRLSSTLTTALEVATEHSLLQPFMEFGQIMLRTLQRAQQPGEGGPAVDFNQMLQALLSSGLSRSVAPRFTAREAAILAQLTDGLALAEVSEHLSLSVNTIKTHVKAIYRKLGVNSRSEAVRVWTSITPSHPE